MRWLFRIGPQCGAAFETPRGRRSSSKFYRVFLADEVGYSCHQRHLNSIWKIYFATKILICLNLFIVWKTNAGVSSPSEARIKFHLPSNLCSMGPRWLLFVVWIIEFKEDYNMKTTFIVKLLFLQLNIGTGTIRFWNVILYGYLRNFKNLKVVVFS